jgi:hypothetical protein
MQQPVTHQYTLLEEYEALAQEIAEDTGHCIVLRDACETLEDLLIFARVWDLCAVSQGHAVE